MFFSKKHKPGIKMRAFFSFFSRNFAFLWHTLYEWIDLFKKIKKKGDSQKSYAYKLIAQAS
jgi:hypothetical protein